MYTSCAKKLRAETLGRQFYQVDVSEEGMDAAHQMSCNAESSVTSTCRVIRKNCCKQVRLHPSSGEPARNSIKLTQTILIMLEATTRDSCSIVRHSLSYRSSRPRFWQGHQRACRVSTIERRPGHIRTAVRKKHDLVFIASNNVGSSSTSRLQSYNCVHTITAQGQCRISASHKIAKVQISEVDVTENVKAGRLLTIPERTWTARSLDDIKLSLFWLSRKKCKLQVCLAEPASSSPAVAASDPARDMLRAKARRGR